MSLEPDMSERMPVVFVSHGAPDALLNAPDAVTSWSQIAQLVPEPAAILVVSAHWEADRPTVSLSGKPETIHDFSGFSPKLYSMRYPAPGAPALAERVTSLLSECRPGSLISIPTADWIMVPGCRYRPCTRKPMCRSRNFHCCETRILQPTSSWVGHWRRCGMKEC